MKPIDIELLQLALSPSDRGRHAQREIVCRRPYRDGGLRIEAEDRPDGRRVIHCYGHGGSGWTLAPGCAWRVRELAVAHLAQSAAETRDVTVLGGGVIGLFAAYALAEHRQRHPGSIGDVTIVAEHFEDLTSHNAGGLFEPFSIGAEPDLELLVDSYAFYHQIALGTAPEPEFETFDVELLSLFSAARDPMPALAQLGYVPRGLPARMRIGSTQHDTFVHRYFFMDVALLMQHLLAIVTRLGVRTVRGVRVRELNELNTPVVVQCAGLAARDLVDDPGLRPMLGHLIRLQNQSRALLDIEHELYVMAHQVPPARATLSSFFSTPMDEVLAMFPPKHAAVNDLLAVRFPGGFESPVRQLVEPLYDILRTAHGRLEMDTPSADPALLGLGRLRLFDSTIERNRFVDAIALIWRVAELRNEKALHDRSRDLLAALIPAYAKRFGFILEQPAGLSYFLPILREPVVREDGGRFRYVSEHAASGPVVAGVVGGTTIDTEDLPVHAHLREFSGVAERFHSLGFAHEAG